MDMFAAGEELFNARLIEENENTRDEILDALMHRYALDRPAADLLYEVSELQAYLLFVVDVGIPFQQRIYTFTSTVADDLDVMFSGSIYVDANGLRNSVPGLNVAKYVSADMVEELKTTVLHGHHTPRTFRGRKNV